MAYMRKNVNIFLLFVIVVVIISITGLTTYYQSTYRNLSTSYDAKLSEVENLLADLNKERTALNKTSLELTIKQERETELSGQYTTVKEDLEDTAAELDSTKTVLDTTKNELAQTAADLADKAAENAKLTASLAETKSDLNSCRSSLNSCLGDIDSCTCSGTACVFP